MMMSTTTLSNDEKVPLTPPYPGQGNSDEVPPLVEESDEEESDEEESDEVPSLELEKKSDEATGKCHCDIDLWGNLDQISPGRGDETLIVVFMMDAINGVVGYYPEFIDYAWTKVWHSNVRHWNGPFTVLRTGNAILVVPGHLMESLEFFSSTSHMVSYGSIRLICLHDLTIDMVLSNEQTNALKDFILSMIKFRGGYDKFKAKSLLFMMSPEFQENLLNES